MGEARRKADRYWVLEYQIVDLVNLHYDPHTRTVEAEKLLRGKWEPWVNHRTARRVKGKTYTKGHIRAWPLTDCIEKWRDILVWNMDGEFRIRNVETGEIIPCAALT